MYAVSYERGTLVLMFFCAAGKGVADDHCLVSVNYRSRIVIGKVTQPAATFVDARLILSGAVGEGVADAGGRSVARFSQRLSVDTHRKSYSTYWFVPSYLFFSSLEVRSCMVD